MARKRNGITYFSRDINLTADSRLRKVMRKYGGLAGFVYTEILATIYATGTYYVRWEEDFILDIADRMYERDTDHIQEIFEALVSAGLFDADILSEHGVLTSRGVQDRVLKREQRYNARRQIKQEFSIEEFAVENEETPREQEKTKRTFPAHSGTGIEDNGSGIANNGPGMNDNGPGITKSNKGPEISHSGTGIEDNGSGIANNGPGMNDNGPGITKSNKGPEISHSGTGIEDNGPLMTRNRQFRTRNEQFRIRNEPQKEKGKDKNKSTLVCDSCTLDSSARASAPTHTHEAESFDFHPEPEPEFDPVTEVVKEWNEVCAGTPLAYRHLYPDAMLSHNIRERWKTDTDLKTYRKVFEVAKDEATGRSRDRFAWTLWSVFGKPNTFDQLLAKSTLPPPPAKRGDKRGDQGYSDPSRYASAEEWKNFGLKLAGGSR